MKLKITCVTIVIGIIANCSGIAMNWQPIVRPQNYKNLFFSIGSCVTSGQSFCDISSDEYENFLLLGDGHYIFESEKKSQIKLRIVLDVPDNAHFNWHRFFDDWKYCMDPSKVSDVLEFSDLDVELMFIWTARNISAKEYLRKLDQYEARSRMFAQIVDLFRTGKVYLNFKNINTFLLNIDKLSGSHQQYIGGFLIRERKDVDKLYELKRHILTKKCHAFDNIPIAFIEDSRWLEKIRESNDTWGSICNAAKDGLVEDEINGQEVHVENDRPVSEPRSENSGSIIANQNNNVRSFLIMWFKKILSYVFFK